MILFIIAHKQFNEPKMDCFPSDTHVLDFIKASKAETVIDKVFKVDRDGNVTFFKPDFDGQLILKPVEV